jgi:hypothetical protein
MPDNKYIIITTINPKSDAIIKFEKFRDWRIVVVGDEKSHYIDSSERLCFLSLDDQSQLGFNYTPHSPLNHYARKNIGYLYAIRQGANIIFDTDDDNIPFEEWEVIPFSCNTTFKNASQYLNVYKYFTDEFIWPRGFPINQILYEKEKHYKIEKTEYRDIGVWQGLVNGDPDVDSLYRLLLNKNVTFEHKDPIYLPKGSFSPINSQNTVWTKKFFPLMYLPGTCSFRFTDILRGYIAQKILWEYNSFAGFFSPLVYQIRNFHDPLQDFMDEINMFKIVNKLINILNNTDLGDDIYQNIFDVYKMLVEHKVVSKMELYKLESWITDVNNVIKL